MSEYTDVQPKETFYNGIWFASKMEAQWAVFFTSAEIEYEYQPGYFPKTDGGKYKPDFYLPGPRLFVEVKRDTETGRQEIDNKAVKSIQWGGDIKQILILSSVPEGHSPDGGIWHFPVIYWKADGVEWGWWFFFDKYIKGGKCIRGKISNSKYAGLFRESISAVSDYELRKYYPYYRKEETDPEKIKKDIDEQEAFNYFTFKAFAKANKSWFGKYGQPDAKSVFEEEENE